MFKKVVAFILVLALLLPIGSALATRYYRVSTSWLKAHEKASFSSTVVNKYRRDTAVTIAKKYSGGWAKVRFRPGGKAVFVQSKYLKLCESYTAYVSKNGTNLRKGPATSFPILGVLDTGAKVTVLTHGTTYDYVSTSKGKGYVANNRLRKSQPSRVTAYIKNYEGKRVCLRKGPGTKYKVIADYKSGTKVTIIKYGSKWSKVSVGGKTGYMKSIFLKQAK